MTIAIEELNELEQFFRSTVLPEKLPLNKAVTLNDVTAAVNDSFTMLHSTAVSNKIKEMRLNLLREIRQAIIAQLTS
ncbi:hypothetical protein SAMN05421788_107184 [Filimonas lacunae]|uniref:DUF6965 domain-containing protein n=1 Tax=Filimonas lacunae TaxID=477680 RepID=A0A173MGA9_9BACT|nr:hypothetical protein [Filimonas lacunae]BAV06520.1 hypothetical protein FLA_2539 [Filimonas lacunae]SIT27247.1 hypothetical protein SAMN05421788_107184 [Filimonas lacunae]